MKFIVSSSVLLKQLRLAEGVLSTTSLIPILDTFLFEIHDDVLTILATDGQTSLFTQVPVSDAEPGSVAIPAKMLISILKNLADQPITFLIDSVYGVTLSSSYGNYKLAGFPGSEFPQIAKEDHHNMVHFPASVLQKAIQKTLIFSVEESKNALLSGLNLQINADRAVLFGTDGHRVMRFVREDIRCTSPMNVVIPKKPLLLLKNLLAGKHEEVSVSWGGNNLTFEVDETQLFCRLIDGVFPDCERAIPQQHPNHLILDRNLLLQSVQRVSLFASKENYQIKLKIDDGNLMVYAEDLDNANEAREHLRCQYTGEPLEISFSARSIEDAIRNVDTAEIQIHLGMRTQPALFLPIQNDQYEDQLNLVTPLVPKTPAFSA